MDMQLGSDERLQPEMSGKDMMFLEKIIEIQDMVSAVFESSDKRSDDLLQSLVSMLLPIFFNKSINAVFLRLGDAEYKSGNFSPDALCETVPIFSEKDNEAFLRVFWAPVLGETPSSFDPLDKALLKTFTQCIRTHWGIVKRMQKLELQEDLLLSILNSSPDSIIVSDVEGTILFCSMKSARMFAYADPSEMIGFPLITLILPDEQEYAISRQKGLLAGHHEVVDEYHGLRKDGSIFDIEVKGAFVENDRGEMSKFLHIIRDITDRKQAEERYRTLVEDINDALYEVTVDGTISYLSPAIYKILGYTPKEVIGKNIFSYVYEDDKLRSVARLASLGNRDTDYFEVRYYHKNGAIHWVRVSSTPVYDEKGEIIGGRGVLTDIHDLKKIELELNAGKEQLQNLLNTQSNYVMRTDIEGIYTYANDKYIEEFGWLHDFNTQGLIGTSCIDAVCSYDRSKKWKALQESIASPGRIIKVELDKPGRDGQVRTTLWEYVCMTDSQGTPREIQCLGLDITERVRAEKRVKASEAKYRSLFNNSPEGYLILRGNCFVECNGTAVKMMEGTLEYLVGKSPAEISPLFQPNGKRSSQYAMELITRALRDGAAQFEWCHVKANGEEIHMLVNLNLIVHDGINSLLATWRDISKQRKAEEESLLFHTITDQSGVGHVIATLDGIICYANDEFARMHGYKPDEVIGEPISILHTAEQMDKMKEAVSLIQTEGGFRSREIWRRRKDDSVFPALMNASLIRNDSGIPFYMSATALDISELKAKEKEIRRLSLAIEQSPVAIVVIGLDSRIEYVNPAFTQITGYSQEEAIGQKTDILKSGLTEEALYKELWETILAGKSWKGELYNRKKNGQIYPESDIISPIFDEQGKIVNYLAIKRDLTAEKQVEEERIAREAAEKSNKAKSIFLSNMSHEIRTPLNSIIGFSQILDSDETMRGAHREKVRTIYRSGEHLLALINDILDLSKIEAGKVVYSATDFDLYQQLDDLKNMFELQCRRKRIDLIFDVDESVPRYIYADEAKVRQLLINLLGNAIKFTKEGHVSALFTSIIGEEDWRTLEMTISDTGIGIAESELEGIFDSFGQTEEGRRAGGTGLGLSISKRLVEIAGGKLGVESTQGEGTTFTIEMPYRRASRALHKTDLEKNVYSLKEEYRPCRVLIVDDITDNRDLLRELLEKTGFICTEAENGKEGVEMALRDYPHAILMDLRMPVMDGYEAASIIQKEAGDAIRIIRLSACAFKEEDMKTSVCFDGEVCKPFKNEELLGVLKELLHLEYYYKEESEHSSSDLRELTDADIKKLPKEFCDQVKEFLEQGRFVEIKELLSYISSDYPDVARALGTLVGLYDYHTLSDLFQDR